MIVREIVWSSDRTQLANFDASFSTERIYRVSLTEMTLEISEEVLDTPLHKKYNLESLEHDAETADFAVVAESNEKIVGIATIKYEAWNKRAILTNFYVAPESQRKGVGRALIAAATAHAKIVSWRCLWLETQNVNYPAIQFYTSIGFEFCGFDKTLYNPADVSANETALFFCRFV